eukprot:TRINITY_DN11551_c0_g1_i1.p1 TRINITY_DN11551_c0_g1~~TRINITY_DN11551_c0_g1_i1.p1  ORF type:complete len:218 (+),score=39.47 TRINITY_DN11551_c0_g1_i1:88-741(+)
MAAGRFFTSAWHFGPKHPVIFGCAVSAVKTTSSDYIVQRYFENKENIDWRRNFVFFSWGLVYLGGVQYFIYGPLFTRHLFPSAAAFVAKPFRDKLADRAGQLVVVKQVALDQLVHHPFIFFPAFYQVKDFIEGGSVAEGFRKYRKNVTEDMKLTWSIWVPAFFVNFSICPIWMRIPFVAGVSFVFTMILSKRRGEAEVADASEKPAVPFVQPAEPEK